ncbi:N-acetyl sugar amidotransferase [Akkermansiaceae bacterium]|nr:N-acetyl sugar amidotransferase [Akkermansiaceae bacterium]
MKYCNICLQTDTRPGIKFSADGTCPACNHYFQLKDVDWDERRKELEKVVSFGKKNNYSGYDCIIGVSGGKDSTRQAFFVKDVLKMNPLLVCLGYPPDQVTQKGVDNVSNMIDHGFDCIVINPAPNIWKDLMRKGFFEFTNWAKSTELALFSSVPRLAIAYQIPLIWWGENAAVQLGDLNVMGKSGSDGNNLRKMNTLAGGDVSWLFSEEINKSDILQYLYPSEKEMEDANLRITFLGHFWKDWSLIDNGNFSALRGLETRKNRPWETGDLFGITALDEDWVTLNQMIKYFKYGFGRVSDYVNEDIRMGRISRDEGISLNQKFDGKCSDLYIESFCEYIDISVKEFWIQVDSCVNTDLFIKHSLGNYKPKFKIGRGL